MALSRAQREARGILARFGSNIPVNIEEIAMSCDVAIHPGAMEDAVSGMLVVKDHSAVMGVNESHAKTRQRFTIAHELAHFLLHKETKVFVDASPIFFRNQDSKGGTRVQEMEANAFAAEILMPEQKVREMFEKDPVDPYDESALRRLAAEFGVSPHGEGGNNDERNHSIVGGRGSAAAGGRPYPWPQS